MIKKNKCSRFILCGFLLWSKFDKLLEKKISLEIMFYVWVFFDFKMIIVQMFENVCININTTELLRSWEDYSGLQVSLGHHRYPVWDYELSEEDKLMLKVARARKIERFLS